VKAAIELAVTFLNEHVKWWLPLFPHRRNSTWHTRSYMLQFLLDCTVDPKIEDSIKYY
jgi:hypothetical protein